MAREDGGRPEARGALARGDGARPARVRQDPGARYRAGSRAAATAEARACLEFFVAKAPASRYARPRACARLAERRPLIAYNPRGPRIDRTHEVVRFRAARGGRPACALARRRGRAATPRSRADRARYGTAEASLRRARLQIAESRYRSATVRRLPDGRRARRRRRTSAPRRATRFERLAAVAEAEAAPDRWRSCSCRSGVGRGGRRVLTRLVARAPKDLQTRRLLAQALDRADGHGRSGAGARGDARAGARRPRRSRSCWRRATFGRKDRCGGARSSRGSSRARPIPQTYVLIGRTYRDFGSRRSGARRARARRSARPACPPRALLPRHGGRDDRGRRPARRGDPRVPRGAEARAGRSGGEPRARHGARRWRAATRRRCRRCESAVRLAAPRERLPVPGTRALAVDRPPDARRSRSRARARARGGRRDARSSAASQYQLGARAARRLGAADEAARALRGRRSGSERRADASSGSGLARYLDDSASGRRKPPLALRLESPFVRLTPALSAENGARGVSDRARPRVSSTSGVMHAQASAFGARGGVVREGGRCRSRLPAASQYSLGVAWFNAEQSRKAAAALERALAAAPDDPNRRACWRWPRSTRTTTGRAAELLARRSGRATDPSLQFAYGLALVRSDRVREAEAVFPAPGRARRLAPSCTWCSDRRTRSRATIEAAVRRLERALALKTDVAEANATLGLIYLKQGKLAEAEAALREELAAQPGDICGASHARHRARPAWATGEAIAAAARGAQGTAGIRRRAVPARQDPARERRSRIARPSTSKPRCASRRTTRTITTSSARRTERSGRAELAQQAVRPVPVAEGQGAAENALNLRDCC